MPRLSTLLLCSLSLFAIQCSDSKESPSSNVNGVPPLPASVDASAYSGKCLDLQKTFAHIGNKGFSYPAIRFTSDYKILTGSPSGDRLKTLYARNWEWQRLQLSGIEEFRDTTQSACDTVQIPIAGDITATYKIVDFTPTKLILEFVPFTEPMIPGRPQGKRFVEAIKQFSLNTSYTIELPTPQELHIQSTYRLAPNSCDLNENLSVTDSQIWRWGDDATLLPKVARLTSDFHTRLTALFPDYFPPTLLAERRATDFIEVPSDLIEKFNLAASVAETTCVF